jgi:sugar phosphate isomerase/epimerase
MKLSISNIAWDPHEEEDVISLLQNNGVSGIEIAPTKLWPDWTGADPVTARKFRTHLNEKGFKIPALQAILFGKPELQVFSNPETQTRLVTHINHVAELANALGAKVLVFGSPKNRDPGSRTPPQAMTEASAFFKEAGAACNNHGVQLCIEPNPKVYDCHFLTHWQEAAKMVSDVAHPGIGLHLDTACIYMESDDVIHAIQESAGNIAHFHISEPNLSDFSDPKIDHAAIGKTLRDIHYDGWISIEMRRSSQPLNSIKEAISRVHEWYD